MKLVPLVETTDASYGASASGYARGNAVPVDTEADLIAAALPWGEVAVQSMLVIKDDHDYPTEDCGLCDVRGDFITSIFARIADQRALMLNIYEAEWDPEIIL